MHKSLSSSKQSLQKLFKSSMLKPHQALALHKRIKNKTKPFKPKRQSQNLSLKTSHKSLQKSNLRSHLKQHQSKIKKNQMISSQRTLPMVWVSQLNFSLHKPSNNKMTKIRPSNKSNKSQNQMKKQMLQLIRFQMRDSLEVISEKQLISHNQRKQQLKNRNQQWNLMETQVFLKLLNHSCLIIKVMKCPISRCNTNCIKKSLTKLMLENSSQFQRNRRKSPKLQQKAATNLDLVAKSL